MGHATLLPARSAVIAFGDIVSPVVIHAHMLCVKCQVVLRVCNTKSQLRLRVNRRGPT